jgi:hypothetical protein
MREYCELMGWGMLLDMGGNVSGVGVHVGHARVLEWRVAVGTACLGAQQQAKPVPSEWEVQSESSQQQGSCTALNHTGPVK